MYKITHLERMIIEIDTTVSHGMERIDLFQFLVIPPLFVSHPLDILGLLSVPSTRNPMEVSSINSMSLLYAPINHPNTFNLAMKPTAIGSLVPRHPHMVIFKISRTILSDRSFSGGRHLTCRPILFTIGSVCTEYSCRFGTEGRI